MTATRIDDNMYISSQINEASLVDLKSLGIKTIVNLRQTEENGFMSFENEAKSANMSYAHFPFAYDQWEEAQVDKLMANLDSSAKPCLVFCETGLRAAAVAVAYKESRKVVKQILENNRDDKTPLVSETDIALLDRISMENIRSEHTLDYKNYVSSYIQSKIENAKKRPGTFEQKVSDNFYIAGQVTEEEFRKAKESGIKSVLNLRCASEAGQFGLGILAKEEDIVAQVGLKYVHLEVPRDGPYSLELQRRVETELTALISTHAPVLVHCRTGRRVKEILEDTRYKVEVNSHAKKLVNKVADYVEPALTPECA